MFINLRVIMDVTVNLDYQSLFRTIEVCDEMVSPESNRFLTTEFHIFQFTVPKIFPENCFRFRHCFAKNLRILQDRCVL